MVMETPAGVAAVVPRAHHDVLDMYGAYEAADASARSAPSVDCRHIPNATPGQWSGGQIGVMCHQLAACSQYERGN